MNTVNSKSYYEYQGYVAMQYYYMQGLNLMYSYKIRKVQFTV